MKAPSANIVLLEWLNQRLQIETTYAKMRYHVDAARIGSRERGGLIHVTDEERDQLLRVIRESQRWRGATQFGQPEPGELPEGFQVVPCLARYAANAAGQIHDRRSRRIIRPYLIRGQLNIFVKNGIHKSVRPAGALVLEAFGQPRPKGFKLGFRDGNKTNIALDNLRWEPHTGRNIGKLTPDQVAELRQRHAEGETHARLAMAFGISGAAVFQIVHHKSWKQAA